MIVSTQTRTITITPKGSKMVLDGGSGVDFIVTSPSERERIFSTLGVSEQERRMLSSGQAITLYSTEAAWRNLWRK